MVDYEWLLRCISTLAQGKSRQNILDRCTLGGRLLLQALGRGPFMEDICLQILRYNPSLDVRDVNGDTPLHIAARFLNPEILEALIDQGSCLSARNIRNDTPFEDAIIFGNCLNVSYFLENGVSIQAVDNFFKRRTIVPEIEMCDMLWREYSSGSLQLTYYILIFSAISGPDDFTVKIEETSRFYDDITPILEEALCSFMNLPSDSGNDRVVFILS